MNPVTYEEFTKLLLELNQQKNDIQKQIDDNTLQIIEARSYAKEILDREEEDFKVFSPRKIEDIYKEELEKSNVKQANYENQNQALIAERAKLDSIIFVLEKVHEEISILINRNEEEVDKLEEDENLDNESDNIVDNESNIFSEENSEEEDIIKDAISKNVQNLTYLMHKIELSTKFIRQDPVRTKLELEKINKGIKKVTDDLTTFIDM